MAEIQPALDVDRLHEEVREKYREVAQDPNGAYHFHTGRAHALRLGSPAWPLNELPEHACEAFAGVGNPFYGGSRIGRARCPTSHVCVPADTAPAAFGLTTTRHRSASA